MKKTVYSVTRLSTIDEEIEFFTEVFGKEEEARKYFNDQVEEDYKEIREVVEKGYRDLCYFQDDGFDEKVVNGDYVINKNDHYYESYVYGSASDSTVCISLKEHEVEEE